MTRARTAVALGLSRSVRRREKHKLLCASSAVKLGALAFRKDEVRGNSSLASVCLVPLPLTLLARV